MSAPIKNGKKPVSSKPVISSDDLFGNQLSIPADVQKDLEEQGLEPHWINAQDVHNNSGYHKRGWVPYKRKQSDTITNSEFKFGRDSEGFIRRGDLILGVKTKEDVAKHRAYLAQKANRFKDINRQKAKELQQMAKEASIDLKVHEGFEENE